jgi:acetate kinase
MKVLVLNCGSSSIKYQLFDMPAGEVQAKGLVQRVGEPEGKIDQTSARGTIALNEKVPDHSAGLRRAIELLTHGDMAPLKEISEITAVGHRVVHGGERFSKTVLINDDVVRAIAEFAALAPLHNPPNLLGIKVAREILPKVPQVAVFDTAFHQTMPAKAYLYAVPMALYREDHIRRYGFHGTSHRYVAERAAQMLKKKASEARLITCHLGNGCSIAAIADGKSVDTSMGLTPLEGLVMGTRSGDFDPAIIFHLARVKRMTTDEVDNLFNKRSGLIGLSGKSNDVRELIKLKEAGDKDADLALEIFCYRLKKYIGSYLAVLGSVDAIVFTAGIGENSAFIRERTCGGLELLGAGIDAKRNLQAVGKEADITADGMRVKVLVVPTNEEKLIAMDTYELAR